MSGSAVPGESSSPAGSPRHHWFEPLADFVGPAYLRYSFTKGTEQEATFLIETLGLAPGSKVLDVGCGPGRHSHALARHGCGVVGIDISERFVALAADDAPAGAVFARADARALPIRANSFDAVISLCQGGFGLPTDPAAPDDSSILTAMAGAVRPGGRVALTAFSSYFMVRHLEDSDDFDPATGVNHELAPVKDAEGDERNFDLWTACYTPRELRLLAATARLDVVGLWSVTPGRYEERLPDLDHPELLLIAERVVS
ncbi:MAG: class I SAM-dependent methyltransferase [Acidimicrobiia bacterium]|nr:class I SAM-dependent methyltransferase [Acidimicrobiia bacterium]